MLYAVNTVFLFRCGFVELLYNISEGSYGEVNSFSSQKLPIIVNDCF